MKRLISLLLVFAFVAALSSTTLIIGCSPSPSGGNQGGNQGGGNQGGNQNQGTPTITISGKITNYTSGWKPYALKGSTYIYGSVAASGEPRDYSIQVPQNWGPATVGIYKDNNNNNQLDTGEETITKPVVVGTANLTVHFEIVTFVLITGKLTGNPTPQWKVGVMLGQSIPEFIYGTVNTSTWDYTNKVPTNSYIQSVFAFRDDNNNNQYDFGELQFRNPSLTNFRIISNVSGDINIPPITNMTLVVRISNNVYGLKIGVSAFNTDLGTTVSSTPNNSVNYEHILTVSGNSGNDIEVSIYYDANNNNQLDIGTLLFFPISKEGVLELTNINFATGTNTLGFNLVPHSVTGVVQLLGGASGLKPVLTRAQGSGFNIPINYGSTSGSSYSINYYTISSTTYTNFTPAFFKDANNNSLYEIEEPIVYWYNTQSSNITVDPSIASTNAANFYILRTLLNFNLTGTDANQFRFVENVILGTYKNLPLNNHEIYSDTNDVNMFYNIIFRDLNGDGIFDFNDPSKDIIGFSTIEITNQTTINLNYQLVKLTVTNTISNISALTDYPNAHIVGQGLLGNQGFISSAKTISTNTTNVVIEAYSTKSFPVDNGYFVVSVADNYTLRSVYPNSIATNADGHFGFTNIISSDKVTNITWFVTN
ncbi:MAG: hypothetical protein RMJ37_07565 [Spirochaetia bacterium]|nr:hypothetical protein [Spirochaetota bacterium]MDW8113171.1 hypothetical protein [Spirochaetia bacterium]